MINCVIDLPRLDANSGNTGRSQVRLKYSQCCRFAAAPRSIQGNYEELLNRHDAIYGKPSDQSGRLNV